MTRRMHVTGYLADEPRELVFRFIDAASRIACFDEVLPVRRMDGTIVAVAFYSRDADNGSASIVRACGMLSRIPGRDTELTSPWDATRLIPGKGAAVQGQVVTGRGELASSAGTGHE